MANNGSNSKCSPLLGSHLEGLRPEIDISRPAALEYLSGLDPVPIEIPAIFVVGSPRSGTTLTGNVIGAHSQCASGDESMFMLNMWQMFDGLVLGSNRRHSSYLNSFTTPQRALGHISTMVGGLYGDLVNSKPGARIAVDHTPVYPHVFGMLNKLFPEATYVHVVREPEGVVESLKKVKQAGGEWGQSSDEARLAFRDHWIAMSRNIGKVVGDQFFEISYESLCSDAQKELSPALESLGLDWEPSMDAAMKVRYAQN